MNLVSFVFSILFVYLSTNAGTTDSSVISNPTTLQDFYSAALNKLYDALEQDSKVEQLSQPDDSDNSELNIFNIPPHIFDGLSNPDYSSTSLHPTFDGDNMKTLVGVQKRSKSDGKRAQDLSRLAMRILKRNGQDKRSKSDAKRTQDLSRLAMRILKRNGGQGTSRVAMRILKKKRGRNAARIAMRVLRKRDEEHPNQQDDHMENQPIDNHMNRVTRLPHQLFNIGGHFGGLFQGFRPWKFGGALTNYPRNFYDTSFDVEKREDSTSDGEHENSMDNEDET